MDDPALRAPLCDCLMHDQFLRLTRPRRFISRHIQRLPLFTSIAFLLLVCRAVAAPFALAVDVRNDLYRVELKWNGNVEFITHIGVDEVIGSIALSKDGRLYAVDADGGFYEINQQSGGATHIGDTGIDFIGGLDFSGDVLQGLTFDFQPTVFSIDVETGVATNVRQTVRAPGYGRALATIDEDNVLLATEGPQRRASNPCPNKKRVAATT